MTVWQVPAEQSQALAAMARRSMQLQVSIQDGHAYVSDGSDTTELLPQALWRGGE